ncbi:MAG: hypothetical protein ACRDOK_30260, partial [Streptosporangiaceae bacterium]
ASEETAMTMKIPLRLRGIDLRDADAYARIDPQLAELSWDANGGVSLAVVYTEDQSPVEASAEWARRIAKLMRGVEVTEVHDELVGISDIAARTGVADEAARLWAVGKRRSSVRSFPLPRQVVKIGSGGRSMSLYAWRDVVSWVRDVLGIDPDDGIDYLDDAQHAHLNAELADIAVSAATWHPISSGVTSITRDLPTANYADPAGADLPSLNPTTRHDKPLHVALA